MGRFGWNLMESLSKNVCLRFTVPFLASLRMFRRVCLMKLLSVLSDQIHRHRRLQRILRSYFSTAPPQVNRLGDIPPPPPKPPRSTSQVRLRSSGTDISLVGAVVVVGRAKRRPPTLPPNRLSAAALSDVARAAAGVLEADSARRALAASPAQSRLAARWRDRFARRGPRP